MDYGVSAGGIRQIRIVETGDRVPCEVGDRAHAKQGAVPPRSRGQGTESGMIMARSRGIGFLLTVIVLGVLIGGVIGEIIGLLMPEGVIKEFFISSVRASVGPVTLDLHAFSVTLGFGLKLNIISVLGVCLVAYLFRWYR